VASITLDHVSKVFDKDVTAVDDVTLEIADGEFLVLVGPSGCGKSTLLRMIAGLEETTSGGVFLGDRDITWVPPRERNLAMVFQNYALYPPMTVRRNLAFSLKLRRQPKAVIAEQVDRVAAMLGLEELLDRRPGQLSGGQRQRVAMGRALVRDPEAFLMDEPLSNLDAKLRVTMRAELADLHQRTGTTTVYVTHDQIEAMTLGHRVAVMRSGVLQQCATPTDLFHRPVNLFCATFIGSPEMNLVAATLDGDVARFSGTELPVTSRPSGSVAQWILGVRPTDLVPAASAPGLPTLTARVDHVEHLGASVQATFALDAPQVRPDADTEDEELELAAVRSDRARWTAELPDGVGVAVGDVIELGVVTERLHWFDPSTGERAPGT
jgi:multiple sugar transport system ATP-binding protein